jgi:hypothetical protein
MASNEKQKEILKDDRPISRVPMEKKKTGLPNTNVKEKTILQKQANPKAFVNFTTASSPQSEKVIPNKDTSVFYHNKPSNESLEKYCGVYEPEINEINNEKQIPLTIILNDNNLYRHLDNGVPDARLISISPLKFNYDDDSGRNIAFEIGKGGEVLSLIISSKGRNYKFNKKN